MTLCNSDSITDFITEINYREMMSKTFNKYIIVLDDADKT